MPLMAITRPVSRSINNCALSFHTRQPIDVAKATAQHKAYQDCLTELGVQVVSLAAEPDLPDAVFVEDPAVIVDEVAIISIMGAPAAARSPGLAVPCRIRRSELIGAALEGGDVCDGRRYSWYRKEQIVGFGLSEILRALLSLQAIVRPVFHLKSVCSYMGTIPLSLSILVIRSHFGF